MNWQDIAHGIFMADLYKAGIALGLCFLAFIAWCIANWLGK